MGLKTFSHDITMLAPPLGMFLLSVEDFLSIITREICYLREPMMYYTSVYITSDVLRYTTTRTCCNRSEQQTMPENPTHVRTLSIPFSTNTGGLMPRSFRVSCPYIPGIASGLTCILMAHG